MSEHMEEFEGIDRATALDAQRLFIKLVELHALGMGYTSAGNRPDNTARIEITGTTEVGTVTRFILQFYPSGDTRLAKPFYNADRTTLTIFQSLDALPGWIATLTNISGNEGVVITYFASRDRYEFECLRRLTYKL